jgi:two-component system, chemotaxis family, protein-glutamate methylesterase/glutaminase
VDIKVLIVDDSQFFCRRVGSILNAVHDIKIVGVANNGREAIEKAEKLQPDVITLDVEMPVMDGITALKQIIKVCDARVLMLSSMTYENAKITLDALAAGATDFLLKSYESMSSDSSQLVIDLQKKIRELGGAKKFPVSSSSAKKNQQKVTVTSPRTLSNKFRVSTKKSNINTPLVNSGTRLVAIGSSTGGPVALQKVLSTLPANFPFPITVTQHMPGTFTGAFATRLDGLCQLKIVEAQDGMILTKGNVYIAPGGKQMVFDGSSSNAKIRVRPTDPRLQFSPSVDVTFGSASKLFGGSILAIILTGMGADGTEGCRLIKAQGGQVWSQDEATSVVYGMPMSVSKAGLSDIELPIDRFAPALTRQG